MSALSERGYICAGVIWFLLIVMSSTQASCTQPGTFCNGGDLILFGLISGGLLIPAKFITIFLGGFISSLLEKNDPNSPN